MKLRNLLIGAGSILNLFPAPRPPLQRPKFMDRTDEEALESDLKAVGDDMRAAMKEIDEEIGGDSADELGTWNDDGGQ
jgi:hypothetical protein